MSLGRCAGLRGAAMAANVVTHSGESGHDGRGAQGIEHTVDTCSGESSCGLVRSDESHYRSQLG